MRKLFFYLILIPLFFSSCKKEETIACPPAPEIPNYLPMSVGDYWVYENFYVDTLGNDSSIGVIDSVYISTDTVINGKTYYVFRGTNYPVKMQPNMLLNIVEKVNGDLINLDGTIVFSSTNFSDTLKSRYETHNGDTLFFAYSKMDGAVLQFTVPLGTYNSLIRNDTYFFYRQFSPINPRIYPYVYGENIGLISSSISYSSTPWHYERRLIRASVNK